MTRMTGPDCAVMCNLINIHTYIDTYITTSTDINHVDSVRFSSRCCTLRRTHTSADAIRILCIPLALILTLSRPPGFASSAKLMVRVSPRALRFVEGFSCDCMFWDDREGGLTGQPMGPQVDTANIRTILSTNHVDSRRINSRCWAFRRTNPSADPIRLLGIRLALPLTLSFPSGFVPSTELMDSASPRALGLVKGFSCVIVCFGTRGEEDVRRWAHEWTQQPLEQYLAQIAWTRDFLARDAVRFDVHTQAQTLFGYVVSD